MEEEIVVSDSVEIKDDIVIEEEEKVPLGEDNDPSLDFDDPNGYTKAAKDSAKNLLRILVANNLYNRKFQNRLELEEINDIIYSYKTGDKEKVEEIFKQGYIQAFRDILLSVGFSIDSTNHIIARNLIDHN